jgi:uncharacterized protein YukE
VADQPPESRLGIHSQMLDSQAHEFADQATRLQDALRDGRHLLEQLESKGLGWDDASRPFSLPYWAQQDKVLTAMKDTVNVFVEVSLGLTRLSRFMAGADEEVAERFRHLYLPAEIDPYAKTDYSRLPQGRTK